VELSEKEIAEHPVGAYPADYQRIVTNYMATSLKDPFSAQYDWNDPHPGAMWTGVNGGEQYGYVVVVGVNARNSFGGYTGEQLWQILIRDGQVRFAVEPGRTRSLVGG
jgi:hypothetical protein